jgi:hypothetical protein
MKTLIKVGLLILVICLIGEAQSKYPYKTIREIQFVNPDSLLVADQIQNSQPTRWKVQASSIYLKDTVRIVGVCIVPPKVLNFSARGYEFVLADTGYSGPWGHMLIRAPLGSGPPSTYGDSIYYQTMLAIEVGDIIEVTGWIDEFPVGSANGISSTTQMVPLRDPNYTLIGSGTPPPVYKMATSDFYQGAFPDLYPNGIKFSTGEPYEGAVVELTNLTVVSVLNGTNGTVNMTDDFGNMISTLDASKWFTMRSHRDPASSYQTYPLFTRIDTMRGYITSNSGAENARGYRICPLYPNDVKIGVARPSITSVRRYPVIVTPDSVGRVEAVIRMIPGGKLIASRQIYYSINNAPFDTLTMQMISGDTLYRGSIPIQPIGTFIKYYIQVTDTAKNFTISASGAGGGLGSDTSRGFYFYKVTDGNLTIQDVQYTPFTNGRSPYVGAVTTLKGIVTADINDLVLTARSGTGGTTVWYIQSGNGPTSGIWINGTLDTLKSLRDGDSVAVTGTIQENFDVTRLGNVSAVQWFTSNNSLPEPAKLTTNIFGASAGNGDLNAEPWEGMLVQFDTVTVTNVEPVYQNVWEYSVSDGSADMNVLKEGLNTYSQIPNDTIYPGTTIIKVGDKFSKLTGIVFYSFNRYKIVPRTNADFGSYVPLSVSENLGGQIPQTYSLSNNYPNPFNPTTHIEYALPKEDKVTLKIYNVIGQEVATLKNEIQKAGFYRVAFDGSKLSSGVYFYRLQTSAFNQVKKMLLVK